jgi:hypothetical protein
MIRSLTDLEGESAGSSAVSVGAVVAGATALVAVTGAYEIDREYSRSRAASAVALTERVRSAGGGSCYRSPPQAAACI